jgi:hypothetical protein
MKQKIRESGFKATISEALYDYIDYGNAFGEVTYENETHQTGDGTVVSVYSGPKTHRISPYDIYFDLSASDFRSAGKVTRTVVSMGSLLAASESDPSFAWVKQASRGSSKPLPILSGYGKTSQHTKTPT